MLNRPADFFHQGGRGPFTRGGAALRDMPPASSLRPASRQPEPPGINGRSIEQAEARQSSGGNAGDRRVEHDDANVAWIVNAEWVARWPSARRLQRRASFLEVILGQERADSLEITGIDLRNRVVQRGSFSDHTSPRTRVTSSTCKGDDVVTLI
jgi:hypothetical protein